MADADDTESWFESALRYAELAAHQIARLRNPRWNPTWRDLVPDEPLPPARSLTAGWGSRGRRSGPAAARFGKRDSAACSPATPFEFGSGSGSGSGASTSGGEDGSSSPEKAATAEKRRRADGAADVSGAGGGCETKVVGIERAPLVFGISAGKDIRRTGKKKTLCELQEEEKLLVEEKNMLKTEMELRRKAYEALRAENQRLKSQQISFRSERASLKSATARASSSAPNQMRHNEYNKEAEVCRTMATGVFVGALAGLEEIDRRPYHENCDCALHNHRGCCSCRPSSTCPDLISIPRFLESQQSGFRKLTSLLIVVACGEFLYSEQGVSAEAKMYREMLFKKTQVVWGL